MINLENIYFESGQNEQIIEIVGSLHSSRNNSIPKNPPSNSLNIDNTTMLEKPLKPVKLKSRSNSTEKNYEIHPEISLAQIQNSRATKHHNKRFNVTFHGKRKWSDIK